MIVVNSRFLTQRVTGVQRYAAEISRQFKKISREIEFISPKNLKDKELAKFLGAKTLGKLSGHTWEQTVLPLYLRKKGSPLLANLGNTSPLLYKNKIITIHDLSFLRNPEWFPKKFYLYYRFLIPATAKQTLKIITVSDFSKREIMNILNLPSDKIEVIYHGISEKFKKQDAMDRNYNGLGNFILGIGFSDPRKNLKRVISAYEKIEARDTKLVLVGAPTGKVTIRKIDGQGNFNDKVAYYGYVSDEDLAKLYNHAKLLIYPSLYEGFGLPPLEAMACGCPAVVSNLAALPEVCGNAAYYVDPSSTDSIAEGMHKVLNDASLRQSLIQKGLERARLFDWERSAEEHLRVFREVLGS